MKIKRHKYDKSTIEVKRLYLPFALIEDCPHCGEEVEKDLEDQYLSYPVLNGKETIYFYCEGCNEDFQRCIILDVTIKEFKKNDKGKE